MEKFAQYVEDLIAKGVDDPQDLMDALENKYRISNIAQRFLDNAFNVASIYNGKVLRDKGAKTSFQIAREEHKKSKSPIERRPEEIEDERKQREQERLSVSQEADMDAYHNALRSFEGSLIDLMTTGKGKREWEKPELYFGRGRETRPSFFYNSETDRKVKQALKLMFDKKLEETYNKLRDSGKLVRDNYASSEDVLYKQFESVANILEDLHLFKYASIVDAIRSKIYKQG